MVLNFRLKQYQCNYYAGDKFYSSVCFAPGYEGGEYGQFVYLTYIWPKGKQEQLNYCFFDKNTLIEYFTEISKLLGFKLLTLIEEKHKYKLQIKCIKNYRYFIYLSTYIRYVYEAPFAILLYAAWYNRHSFPELNIIHIMQYYLTLFYNQERCHCPGKDNYTFSNMNVKCQFNLIHRQFNDTDTLVYIHTEYKNVSYDILRKFHDKQLNQIVKGLNFIANNYYVRDKENICRW